MSVTTSRVGSDLRAARQRLGYTLPAIAAHLRIRLPFLEAIEDGRISDLPGNAYAVGFLRTYAQALGLDPDEVARRFKAEANEVNRKTELDFPAPVPDRGIPAGAIVLLGVVIAIGAYVGWYRISGRDHPDAEIVPPVPGRLAALSTNPAPPPAPSFASNSNPPPIQSPAAGASSGPSPSPSPPLSATMQPSAASMSPAPASPAPAIPASGTPAMSTSAPSAAPLPGVPLAKPSAPAAGQGNVAAANTPFPATQPSSTQSASIQPAATQPASAQPSAGSASATAPAAGSPDTGRMVLRAKADAWVQVREKQGGAILLNRVLRPGETWAVPVAKSQLLMTTGNAAGTELLVDGVVTASLGGEGAVRRDLPLDPEMARDGKLAPGALQAAPGRPAAAPVIKTN